MRSQSVGLNHMVSRGVKEPVLLIFLKTEMESVKVEPDVGAWSKFAMGESSRRMG